MDNLLKYEKLVSKIAKQYSTYSSFEDLRQVGMIGLIKALKKYVKSENTKFSTYAYVWIKGEILEYLRCDRNIKLSKEMIMLNKEINICRETLRNRLNKEPSTKEIAFFLEKDIKTIEDSILANEVILSCDYTEEDVDLYNCLPYHETRYDAEILDLYKALDELTKEEKELIEMRYFDDLTQSEISKKLGTNQVNISRKEEKILSKLNKRLVV